MGSTTGYYTLTAGTGQGALGRHPPFPGGCWGSQRGWGAPDTGNEDGEVQGLWALPGGPPKPTRLPFTALLSPTQTPAGPSPADGQGPGPKTDTPAEAPGRVSHRAAGRLSGMCDVWS